MLRRAEKISRGYGRRAAYLGNSALPAPKFAGARTSAGVVVGDASRAAECVENLVDLAAFAL